MSGSPSGAGAARLLAVAMGFVLAVLGLTLGTGRAATQNVVGAQPVAMILTLGPHDTGVHPAAGAAPSSTTGSYSYDAGFNTSESTFAAGSGGAAMRVPTEGSAVASADDLLSLQRDFVAADSAAVGASRESAVADLTGGRVLGEPGAPGMKIVQPGVGSTDVDVLGPNGEYIAVGGPAKAANLAKLGQKLNILKYAAGEAGVPGQAYFARGTPQSAIDLANKILGDDNVFTFGP